MFSWIMPFGWFRLREHADSTALAAAVKPPQNPASKGKYEPYRDAFGLL